MKQKNIVLIGMPGCGKSTIGELIANKMKVNFYDTDIEIEKLGRGISEIFEKDGEKTFRKIESEVIEKTLQNINCIISLGGGAILKEQNMKKAKLNSIIVFINRPIENIINDIKIEERPLLKNGVEKIYELHNKRIELYKKYADIEVVNDKSIEDVISKIIAIIIQLEIGDK